MSGHFDETFFVVGFFARLHTFVIQRFAWRTFNAHIIHRWLNTVINGLVVLIICLIVLLTCKLNLGMKLSFAIVF